MSIDNSDTIDELANLIQPTRTPISIDGYGFRKSGVSTPQFSEQISDSLPMSQLVSNLVPDPDGLGWPGLLFQYNKQHFSLSIAAKSTVSRLNASPQEKAAREQKMASAIRTILECIGEDPDREGLKRTPERYAQAIMWMTRGYEERLAGR
jgi:GTP cyclohydrolase I